jgi:hypothetical protein
MSCEGSNTIDLNAESYLSTTHKMDCRFVCNGMSKTSSWLAQFSHQTTSVALQAALRVRFPNHRDRHQEAATGLLRLRTVDMFPCLEAKSLVIYMCENPNCYFKQLVWFSFVSFGS